MLAVILRWWWDDVDVSKTTTGRGNYPRKPLINIELFLPCWKESGCRCHFHNVHMNICLYVFRSMSSRKITRICVFSVPQSCVYNYLMKMFIIKRKMTKNSFSLFYISIFYFVFVIYLYYFCIFDESKLYLSVDGYVCDVRVWIIHSWYNSKSSNNAQCSSA